MNPYYELPTLATSFRQATTSHPDWHGRARTSGRQIDEILSVGILRIVQGLETVVRGTVGWIARQQQRRTAIRELQAMSDHFLADIGLERDQIAATVDQMIETGE